MRLEFEAINKYAKEQGFEVFGNRYIRKDFSFELKCHLGYLGIYFNNSETIAYSISTITDCINFCNLISSLSFLSFYAVI